MEARTWQQVEGIFHEALALPAAEREAYLARVCHGDAELRREVESLLASFEGQETFLDENVLDQGLKAFTSEPAPMLVGKTIGSYEVQRLLGRGGMGEVYLAEDKDLGRKVALKFLTSSLLEDAWAKRRLIKEAQAVAMLDHPNICPVHGIEEIDNRHFIVMQYIEGSPLSQLIEDKATTPEQVLSLSRQMASAIAEAHAHGIVHRDIKPQNMMVTPAGQLKVLDFGLAKISQPTAGALGAINDPSQFSQLGLIAGTVAYMSPEQLRAERLDARTDIFSLGSVLYELIEGRHPFARANQADTILAILSSQPPPLSKSASRGPSAFEQIINRCLLKEKEGRYPSAQELLLDLQGIDEIEQPRKKLKTWLSLLGALTLFLLIAVGFYYYFQFTRNQTLAILPFTSQQLDEQSQYLITSEKLDEQHQYLIGALPAMLTSRLSRLSALKVKAPLYFGPLNGQKFDLRQVGREIGAETVLSGRILTADGSTVLRLTLTRASDGKTIWAQDYPFTENDLILMQERIARDVLNHLNLWVGTDDRRSLSAQQTTNPEAYRRYLLGRHFWERRDEENIKKAIEHFEAAIELDPLFALAYAGLADVYVNKITAAYDPLPIQDAMSKARGAAIRAVTYDTSSAEAHTALGVVKLRCEWKLGEAEKQFLRAIELNPDYTYAHYWYSQLLHLTKHTQEAIWRSQLARELDPFSALTNINVGRAYYYARQFDEAEKILTQFLAKYPDNTNAAYNLGLVYLQQHNYDQARIIFEKIYDKNQLFGAAPLGVTYARLGQPERIQKIFADLKVISAKKPVPPQEIAILHMARRDFDQAFIYLEKAMQEHYPPSLMTRVDPLFDDLRSDPRYAALVDRFDVR
jgi:serine/threonine protein kinase/Tfp pilus assembly protein PilF